MRLAREAMRVPRPPTFVPTSRPFQSSVKVERSTAAGTLLMTWLARAEVTTVFQSIRPVRKVRTAPIRPRLPEKTKKHTKVHSRA